MGMPIPYALASFYEDQEPLLSAQGVMECAHVMSLHYVVTWRGCPSPHRVVTEHTGRAWGMYGVCKEYKEE